MVSVKQETVIISTAEARNLLSFEEIKVEPTDILEMNPPIHSSEVSVVAIPLEPEISAGVHFLTDESEDSKHMEENYERKKLELLEYMTQSDGSVVCKHCGEVLASRTHWYRHKYKVHVSHFGNPSPLFKCEQCNVFFKSRRGYMGHYSSRHPKDSIETGENGENLLPKEESSTENPSSPPHNTVARRRSFADKTQDWEEQRIKEEKLVSDIINRVKKECEAQGELGSRRGYTRRTTSVMNNSCSDCMAKY